MNLRRSAPRHYRADEEPDMEDITQLWEFTAGCRYCGLTDHEQKNCPHRFAEKNL